ncbi:MAG: isoleucine--tRNA ligase [Bacilli bacterium]|nr:isoleucine--tRNA ligase [Bacilli bacterium]
MELKKSLNMFKGDFQMKADLAIHEPEYVKRWTKMDLYNKMRIKREGCLDYYLHDGPPYANGDIHCGHALNKIVKDAINRYQALKGYHITYIPGWDTHGLPIENALTKSGVNRKEISVADFRRFCMKYAYKQVDKQMAQFKRLGVIGDFDHPYITLTKDYEADEIHVFSEMALKGYIYKGLKPVAWSPSSECALAEAEIEYKDVTARTIYVKFQVEDGKGILTKDDYFVIWTTTPWTIPADTSICLNPKMIYGLYETEKGRLIFLADLKDSLVKEFGLERCELVKEFTGKELEYITVKHPLYERTSLVINGDHVTADSGTGCVHTAGGHGLDDYKVSTKYGLPNLCPVDDKGYMTKEAGEQLEGLFYEEANDKVVDILKEGGYILSEKKIVHSYPHDWRTHKPVIFRATPQWFCSIAKFRNEILEEIEKISFNPSWGKVRLHNMVAQREDWCISRQRAWGVPIPIIYCEDGTPIIEREVFEHIEKLFREFGSNIWFEKEASELLPEGYKNEHSPSNKFTKEKDIMDVWFDSGSSWLSSDINRNAPYPADLYFEGTDQYRGWYNSSLTLAVATGHKSPFKAILTHGFIVDQNGQKFSKSLGNGIAPEDIYNVYGADILRLWAASIDFTTAEIKISEDLIKTISESYRKIRNTFKFMLSNLYDSKEDKVDLSKPYEYSHLDELVFAKEADIIRQVDEKFAKHDHIGAVSLIENYMINDLSSFYLDYAKDILYCDSIDSLRRKGVQHVLYILVHDLAIVLSPVLCFTMEEVYDHMPNKKEESVALEDFPSREVDEKKLAMYNCFMDIRSKVFKKLEEERADGCLASNTEAVVNYSPSKEEKETLDYIGDEMVAKALIVSEFSYTSKELEVTKSNGVKCERCWNYVTSYSQDDEGHNICPRCKEVIEAK